MSGSFHRPSPVRQAFRASVKADPGESDLCAALSEAEHQLDGIQRVIGFRVDNDAPAATHTMLDDMRRIADRIKAAADKYQWGMS
jgi:hypothetical protein